MSNGHDPPKFLDHPLFGRSYTLRLPDGEQEEPKDKEKREIAQHPLFTRSFGYERPPPPAGFVGPPDLRAHLPPPSAAELQRQEIDVTRASQATRRAGLTPLYSGEVDVDAGMPGTAVKPIPPGRLDPWNLSPSGGTMGARGPGHRELEKPWSPIIEIPLAMAQVMANTTAEMVKWGLENEHKEYTEFVDAVHEKGLLAAWKADMAQSGTAMRETLEGTFRHIQASPPQARAGAFGLSKLFYEVLGDEDAAAWAEFYRSQSARAVFEIEGRSVAETPGGQFGSVATGFAIGVIPYLLGGGVFRAAMKHLAIPAGAGLFGARITNPKTQRFLLSLAEPVKLRYRFMEDFATGGPIDALMAAGDPHFSTISMLADLSMTERGRRIFRDAGFDPEAFAEQMWAIAEDDKTRILVEPILGAAIAALPITVMHKAGARGRAMRIEEAEARIKKAHQTRKTLRESYSVTSRMPYQDNVLYTETSARAASAEPGLPGPRELDEQLGDAGTFHGDTEEIIGYHVTDSGSRVVAALEDEGRTIIDGYTGPENELGPGLYISAVPERWLNRAQRKWAFAHRLTEEQRGLVVDKIRTELDAKSPGHLSQIEIDRALRDLEGIRTGELDPDQLRRFAEQPYNIRVWHEDWLTPLGIEPGAAPLKVEVRAKGKFADLSRSGIPDGARIRQLMDRGYDGAFINGRGAGAPQLVIWNKRAITQFGEWKPEGRLALDNLRTDEVLRRRHIAFLKGEDTGELTAVIRRRVGRILELEDPTLRPDEAKALYAVRADRGGDLGADGLYDRVQDWWDSQSADWKRNRATTNVRTTHELHLERMDLTLEHYDEVAPGWRAGKAPLEMEGIRNADGSLQSAYAITPDAREPGRFRMTIYDQDGPLGHVAFDTPEEAVRYALRHHNSSGRLVTGAVDEMAMTPRFLEGMKRIAELEKVNAKAAEASFGERNAALSAEDLALEGELTIIAGRLEADMMSRGLSDTHCTTCAGYVQMELGRGEVWGYEHSRNPTARLGQFEGGHDFLIVDNKFLVDTWGVNSEVRLPQPVLHLVRDAEIIRAFYGDPDTWSHLGEYGPESWHPREVSFPQEAGWDGVLAAGRGAAQAKGGIELDRSASQVVRDFSFARDALEQAGHDGAEPKGDIITRLAQDFAEKEARLELLVENQRKGQPSVSSTKVSSEAGTPLSIARSGESGRPSSQSPAVSRGSTAQAPSDQRSTTMGESMPSASSRTTGPLKSETLGAPKTRTGEPPYAVGENVTHPETGETWIAFHPTENIHEIIANGYRGLPKFKQDLEGVIAGRGTLYGVRVKADLVLDVNGKPTFDENGVLQYVSDENGVPVPNQRAFDKAETRYPYQSNQFAPDVNGGRLWVDRLEDIDKIVSDLEKLGYRVLENDDWLKNESVVKSKLGYRARHLIVYHDVLGASYELQIMSREIGAVQEQAHQYYERSRSPDATPRDVLEARAESEALYTPAHQAYLDRVEAEGPQEVPPTRRETALEVGQEIPGAYGRRSELIVGGEGQRVSGRYRVVEADDVIPSHRWDDSQIDDRHPGNVRGYHRDPAAQAHVDTMAREHDPGQTLMVTQSPAMGPPVMRGDGILEGGNGRGQAIQRMYALYPEAAEGYRSELLRRAESDFGITDPITTYKKPILVFEVDESPTDVAGWSKRVSDLNYDPQKALDPLSDSFQRGRRLRESPAALAELTAKMPPEMTIRAFLNTPDGEMWFSTLVRDGIIDGTELSAFVSSSTMNLTSAGKDAIERMLLGAAFTDIDAINAAPASVLNQINHALPVIVRTNQIPGYELGEIVQEALELLSRVYQKGTDGKRVHHSASEYFAQGDLLEVRGHTEEAEIFARFLDENGPRNTSAAFRRYGSEADYALNTGEMAGGADLFGRKAKARGELIDVVFGDGTVRKTPGEVGFGSEGRLSLPFGREPPKPGEPKVTFDDPDMETRWQDAGEPQVRTFRDRIRDTLETFRHSTRRRFEHLASGPRWEVARFELLRLMKQSDVAVERGIRRIERITELMDPQEYDLFVRKVVLDDLAEELRINPDHELPFGLTPETLEIERMKVEAAILETPNVVEAVKLRHAEWSELRGQYVAQMERIGVNLDERFQREYYYHHQVVEKARETRRLRTVNSQLKTPTRRGFLKRRTGSDLDISTDYLAAEFEVMAQLEYDMEVARTLEKIQKEYDIYDRVRATAKDAGAKWQDGIPDGYTVYRPREGTTFYRAYSVPERLAVNLLEAAQKSDDAFATLTADELRQVLARGGPFKPMVVPDEIARTLNNLPTGPKEALARLSSKTLGLWKEWQLISPRRYVKYNLRNLSGDIEVTLTGNFRAFRQVRQATSELYTLFTGGEMSAHMREWYERGGMQTTLQVQEIGDIHKLNKVLGNLAGAEPNVVRRGWDVYWRFARESTDFREAILRYANYLEYMKQMRGNKGRPLNFGASIPEEVMVLPDIRDRAFKMSNELVGAYDQISVAGAHIRRHFIPFWSFQEINMRRYTQMIKNAARDDELALTVGRRLLGKVVTSPLVAVRVGAFAIKATGMWMGLQVYNNLMWGDLEDELSPEVQGKPHIILGRAENGNVRVFTRLGALGDFLEWFGLDTPVDMASDWLSGRRTTNEIITDMAKAPVNKIVGGITPIAQYPFTLLTRRTLWPDAFKPGTVRDRAAYIAQSVGLENEFKALADRPTDRSYLESLKTLPYYEVNPGEAAVWYTIEEKGRWLRKQGKYSEGFFINPKSNALWNLKKAMRYGDKDAMIKYLLDYAELGGSEAGLKGAFKSLHPLAGLSLEKGENGEPSELEQFLTQMRQEDRDRLKVALAWYDEVMGSRETDDER